MIFQARSRTCLRFVGRATWVWVKIKPPGLGCCHLPGQPILLCLTHSHFLRAVPKPRKHPPDGWPEDRPGGTSRPLSRRRRMSPASGSANRAARKEEQRAQVESLETATSGKTSCHLLKPPGFCLNSDRLPLWKPL